MLSRIVCGLLVYLAGFGSAHAQVNGVLDTPFREILLDGPYATTIRLELGTDVEVDEFPSFMNGGLEVRIVGPDGAVRFLNQETVYGGDYGQYSDHPVKVFSAGNYVVPIFLLKNDGRFIFSQVGVYEIEFRFKGAFEGMQLEEEIVVRNCIDCDRENYRKMFYYGPYTSIFERGFRSSATADELGEYSLMADIARACCLGGGWTVQVLERDPQDVLDQVDVVEFIKGCKRGTGWLLNWE